MNNPNPPPERSVEDVLTEVVKSITSGGEERTSQRRMVRAVAQALRTSQHLLVQAGTGTGKTLAYLLPVVMHGKRTIVTTYTKALQDQMVEETLPSLCGYMADNENRVIYFAELKGWKNYVCLQRVQEIKDSQSQGQFDILGDQAHQPELNRIINWTETTLTGDRADLDFVPRGSSWAAVSVPSAECLKEDCPFFDSCFPVRAKKIAAQADVVVVNHALYAADLTTGGMLLGDHEAVVIDEAHQLEDTCSEAFGFELTGTRFRWLADQAKNVLGQSDAIDRVTELGVRLTHDMTEHGPARVYTGQAARLGETIRLAQYRIESLVRSASGPSDEDDQEQRRKRMIKAANSLLEDIQRAIPYFSASADDLGTEMPQDHVAWIETDRRRPPSLKFAPIHVGSDLKTYLWDKRTAILTSATLPTNIEQRLGVLESDRRKEVFDSPFDYKTQSLLYCARHLADPSLDEQKWREGMLKELASLISSAQGRTLALFTSHKALETARDHLRASLDLPILCQGEKPEKRLLTEFAGNNEASLLATRRFWQGIDVPGPTLSLVTIDRLPFPSPVEHLVKARSAAADPNGWWQIELPLCATRLAQGAGRLIRRTTDQGVVAIFDPRLISRSYKPQLLEDFPSMRRTCDPQEVQRFLQALIK